MSNKVVSNKKVVLSAEEILRRQFKVDARGYRMKEVDEFLDMIILDYETYENIIEKLIDKLNELEYDNETLKKQLVLLQTENQLAGGDQREQNNIDLFKRLAMLEKKVYGNEK